MSYTPITEFHLETQQAGSSAWRAYSVSPHADQELYHSAGKLYLTKLEPATAYQARIKSHNKEGMSRWSHVFNFATRGGGEQWVDGSSFFEFLPFPEPKQEQMIQSSAEKNMWITSLIFKRHRSMDLVAS